jgi:hypothetical protein
MALLSEGCGRINLELRPVIYDQASALLLDQAAAQERLQVPMQTLRDQRLQMLHRCEPTLGLLPLRHNPNGHDKSEL